METKTINTPLVYCCCSHYYGNLYLRRNKARNESKQNSCTHDLIQKKKQKEARSEINAPFSIFFYREVTP